MNYTGFIRALFILGVASFFVWFVWPSAGKKADQEEVFETVTEDIEADRAFQETGVTEEIGSTERAQEVAPSERRPANEPVHSDGNSDDYQSRLTLDRALEIAFNTHAGFADIHRELTEAIDAEFPVLEGTWEEIGINEQGYLQVSYLSLNGEEVNQWYDQDGHLVAEEVIFLEGETTLTRWYKADSQAIERVVISDGDRDGAIEFDSTSRPTAMAFRDGEKNMRFRIEE